MNPIGSTFRLPIVLLGALMLMIQALLPALSQQITDKFEPEISHARSAKTSNVPVRAKNWMVAVANPHAAAAAARFLEQGGNAIDAAIAAQLVLGLVEPQSSGLGGGAFLVYFDAKSGQLTTLDGRETAPSAATPKLFQNSKGEPLKFFDAVIGGRSVGVPGTPALLGEMAKRWGTKPWKNYFEPALALSDGGFKVSPRLASLVRNGRERLARHGPTAAYFLPGGRPVTEGQLLRNPDYYVTLRTLSNDGANAFYGGPIAKQVVETVRNFKAHPGLLSLEDMSGYTVKERQPVCASYHKVQICGMGPPSSGALSVGQILGLLEPFDLNTLSPNSPDTWRLIADATRLAFADRGRYMADSDFVKMPTKGLLKPSYLAARSRLLAGNRALETVSPGEPEWDDAALPRADDESLELPSTSHFSIVDGEGNVVSMTTTIESGFGSRLMSGGFLLNNELTDFSFRDMKEGKPVANRVEPGKRPRSSMSPTIVMRDGKPVLAIGSPGGSRIIPYVANALIAWLDWGMNVQEAISRPHLVNRFGTFDLEAGTSAEALQAPLANLGYKTKIRSLNSGLHAIAITPDGLEGGADPRREGVVLGK